MSKSKGIREVGYVDIRQGGGVGHAHDAPGPRMQPMSWFDCAGGGQVVVEKGIAYVGNMRNPHGTLIVDVSDPKHPKQLASVEMPTGTHSHKVRVGNGIMITNREILGAGAARGEVPPPGFRGGLGIYDVSNPAKPRHITNWEVSGSTRAGHGRAPLRLRRALCLHLADLRRLSRQHRDDPRPEEPGETRGGRALVAAGPVDRGRREADVEGHRAPLPSSAALRQPPLHELLVRRLRDPRHRRHDEAEVPGARRLEPAVSVADAHLPAHPVQDRQSRFHGRLRRGRGTARRLPAAPGGLPVDGRHHRREASDGGFDLPDRGHARRGAALHDRLPPAGGAHRDRAPRSRSRGSPGGCASSTSRGRTRSRRWRSTCRTCRRAPSACRATT